MRALDISDLCKKHILLCVCVFKLIKTLFFSFFFLLHLGPPLHVNLPVMLVGPLGRYDLLP